MKQSRLELKNLRKSYNKKTVLNNINLKIENEKGAIIGIVGVNGAGKSTLLRIIAKIDGEYDGHLKLSINEQQVKSKFEVGFLPEERSLPSVGKVYEVLKLWTELRGNKGIESKELIEKWLVKVKLIDYKNTRIKELSKGNKQKLQLACCLLHEPSLIVFDEPFSGLDPSNQELVINLIEERRKNGALIIISAHQLELVERICSEIYLMKEGQLEFFNITNDTNEQRLSVRLREDTTELSFLQRFPMRNNVYNLIDSKLSYEEKSQLFDSWCKQKIQVYYGDFMNLREQYINATSNS